MITEKSPEQLAKDEVVRQALEIVAKRLEEQKYKGNTYQKAFKKAVAIVRSIKI
jgi:hypothetical protein